MALTQQARVVGPSWDEEVVPALRKRLETESRTLARRMSAISISSNTIPSDDLLIHENLTLIQHSPATTPHVNHRSRTYSSPYNQSNTQDPSSRPKTGGSVKPTRIPKASRSPVSPPLPSTYTNLNGIKLGSYSSSNTPNPNLGSPQFKPYHFPTSHSSQANLGPSQPSRIINEPPPFGTGSTCSFTTPADELGERTIRHDDEQDPDPNRNQGWEREGGGDGGGDRRDSKLDYEDELPSRQSIDSEEHPFEHWYRGEVSRNGGVGELRVGRRQEMLEIANYGHVAYNNKRKALAARKAAMLALEEEDQHHNQYQYRNHNHYDEHGYHNHNHNHQPHASSSTNNSYSRKRADSIAGIGTKPREREIMRGSLLLDDDFRADMVGRVLDEDPLTDLDGEGSDVASLTGGGGGGGGERFGSTSRSASASGSHKRYSNSNLNQYRLSEEYDYLPGVGDLGTTGASTYISMTGTGNGNGDGIGYGQGGMIGRRSVTPTQASIISATRTTNTTTTTTTTTTRTKSRQNSSSSRIPIPGSIIAGPSSPSTERRSTDSRISIPTIQSSNTSIKQGYGNVNGSGNGNGTGYGYGGQGQGQGQDVTTPPPAHTKGSGSGSGLNLNSMILSSPSSSIPTTTATQNHNPKKRGGSSSPGPNTSFGSSSSHLHSNSHSGPTSPTSPTISPNSTIASGSGLGSASSPIPITKQRTRTTNPNKNAHIKAMREQKEEERRKQILQKQQQQRRVSVARYQLGEGDEDEEGDMKDAIPSWTQPKLKEGNWDDVVLPVVARKKGLDDQYEKADGSSHPKKKHESVVAPAPGTFGYDDSKYRRRLDDSNNSFPMDEFGRVPNSDDDSNQLQQHPQEQDEDEHYQQQQDEDRQQQQEDEEREREEEDWKTQMSIAHDNIRVPIKPPPSPMPFAHYAPPGPISIQRVPPIGSVKNTNMEGQGQDGNNGRERLEMEEEKEKEKGSGCCGCVVM